MAALILNNSGSLYMLFKVVSLSCTRRMHSARDFSEY